MERNVDLTKDGSWSVFECKKYMEKVIEVGMIDDCKGTLAEPV